jgi:hypothetical protein
LAGIGFSETPVPAYQPDASADGIVGRMMEMELTRTANLQEYTSLRHYRLENERFGKVVESTVRATYRAPGDKTFDILSQSGSTAIASRVFHRMLDTEREAASESLRLATRISPENYQFRLVGTDLLEGRRAYVLDISPRNKNKYTIQGRIWLDMEDFAISKVEGSPAKRPSIWAGRTSFVQTYQKHGAFWLAATNASQSESRWFGRTSILVSYSDYRIN